MYIFLRWMLLNVGLGHGSICHKVTTMYVTYYIGSSLVGLVRIILPFVRAAHVRPAQLFHHS